MSPTEHPALHVLPLSVSFGTDVYMDGVDIDHQRFYEMLVERDELPKTGQVNPYAFSQAIAEAREAGELDEVRVESYLALANEMRASASTLDPDVVL